MTLPSMVYESFLPFLKGKTSDTPQGVHFINIHKSSPCPVSTYFMVGDSFQGGYQVSTFHCLTLQSSQR